MCDKDIVRRIPNEILVEVKSSINEYGRCHNIEYVDILDYGVLKKENSKYLSFCDYEYIPIIFSFNKNVIVGVVYYPFESGYLKVNYSL